MVISIYRGNELIKRTVEMEFRDIQVIALRAVDIAKTLICVDLEMSQNYRIDISEGTNGLMDISVGFYKDPYNMKTAPDRKVSVHCSMDDVAKSLRKYKNGGYTYADIYKFGLYDCVALFMGKAEKKIVSGYKELSFESSAVDYNGIFNVILY